MTDEGNKIAHLAPRRDLCPTEPMSSPIPTPQNSPALWQHLLPIPRADGHKYLRGHALVVSGGPWQTGAARLAARGALRVGAGLVTLASPPDALAINAAHLTAIMLKPMHGPDGLTAILADHRMSALAMGPGLGVGQVTRELVAAGLRSSASHADEGSTPRAFVLDADALTSFAATPQALRALIGHAPGPVVLTPHKGEFSRVFSWLQDDTLNKPDLPVPKSQLASEAARWSGATVVLKGAETIIAHPDGRIVVSSAPMPWLATAGSGDVLAGLITGLLAQGMPAFEAACAAVWMHVEAARHCGPGLIAEDLPEALPKVWASLVP